MKKMLCLILAIGTITIMLPSCQKEVQSNSQLSSQPGQTAGLNQSNTAQGYGGAGIYNIELSANIPGVQGGGIWLWIGLHADGTADYSGADCGHGGAGAANDKGDGTWHYAGTNNESIVINGIVLAGLDGFVATMTVPSKYGHYTGTLGSFITLPSFIPGFIGFSQLQVAH